MSEQLNGASGKDVQTIPRAKARISKQLNRKSGKYHHGIGHGPKVSRETVPMPLIKTLA